MGLAVPKGWVLSKAAQAALLLLAISASSFSASAQTSATGGTLTPFQFSGSSSSSSSSYNSSSSGSLEGQVQTITGDIMGIITPLCVTICMIYGVLLGIDSILGGLDAARMNAFVIGVIVVLGANSIASIFGTSLGLVPASSSSSSSSSSSTSSSTSTPTSDTPTGPQ